MLVALIACTHSPGNLKRLVRSCVTVTLVAVQLLSPRPYLVRVYCLKGFEVQAMNSDGTTSDPFLKLKLGTHHIDDHKNYIPSTVEPGFYR